MSKKTATLNAGVTTVTTDTTKAAAPAPALTLVPDAAPEKKVKAKDFSGMSSEELQMLSKDIEKHSKNPTAYVLGSYRRPTDADKAEMKAHGKKASAFVGTIKCVKCGQTFTENSCELHQRKECPKCNGGVSLENVPSDVLAAALKARGIQAPKAETKSESVDLSLLDPK